MILKLRNLAFFCIFGVFSLSASDKVTIVENSKSDYQIVIPDKDKNPLLGYFWEQSATLLKNCIFESTGASLPVSEESKAIKAKPGIYIGDTAKASEAGINKENLSAWEYVIKTKDKDVILIGRDLIAEQAKKNHSRNYCFYELGTVKAVTSFLESYCGTRFVIPGLNGISVQKKSEIELPSSLNIRKVPFFKYCTTRLRGMYYDIANNFYLTLRYGTYGGHSHNVAIPPDKYFNEHPEYFALVKGKRYTHPVRPQYCLSNPEVQDLIYKELLRKLDEGYDYAQLGQSDGFIPCECDKCKALYGVKGFGEKLWIMHKNMAERLLKDRPDKKVMILSYSSTAEPPETFKDFPSNVMIELCAYSPEFLAKWKKYKVPGGFTVYVYNWGLYHTEGFTPKNTPEFCKQQIELFKNNNIWGLYCCGSGELFGLESPVYYIYGKLLEDSTKDPEKLADEFCDFAYPDSSKPMKAFFRLLHERLKIKIEGDDKTDWNNTNLLNGKIPNMQNNVKVLFLRYPSDVLAKMQAYLNEASNLAKDKKETARINISKMEFEYLKKTALIAELYDKYRKSSSKESFNTLLNAIDARNSFIDSLKTINKGNYIADYEDCSSFGAESPARLKIGGFMQCELQTPYNWDTAWLRKMNIAPGAREIIAVKSATPIKLDGIPDEAVWQKAESQRFVESFMNKAVSVPDFSVQVAYDKDDFYVLFKCKNDLSAKWDEKTLKDKEFFYVFLGPTKTLEETCMFPCGYPNSLASTFKRFKTENPEAPNGYKIIALDKKVNVAWKIDQAGGNITAEYKIPFSIFKRAPQSGDIWYGNFIKRVSDPNTQPQNIDFIWEPNINWKTWRNSNDVMGKIIFE